MRCGKENIGDLGNTPCKKGGLSVKKKEVRDKAYRLVEKILRNQRSIERAVKEARMQSGGHSGGGSGHAYISDPTAQQAVRLATELQAVTLDNGWTVRLPERWLKIVQHLYRECPATESRAMRYYYSGHSAVETGVYCAMDESTVYRIRQEFRHMATELACQLGLVRVASVEEMRA